MRSISSAGVIFGPNRIETVLSRLFIPFAISMSDFGSLSAFAITCVTALLASPSLACAATQMSITSSVTEVMPSLFALAPGLTWQSNCIVPVAVRPFAALPTTNRMAAMINI